MRRTHAFPKRTERVGPAYQHRPPRSNCEIRALPLAKAVPLRPMGAPMKTRASVGNAEGCHREGWSGS